MRDADTDTDTDADADADGDADNDTDGDEYEVFFGGMSGCRSDRIDRGMGELTIMIGMSRLLPLLCLVCLPGFSLIAKPTLVYVKDAERHQIDGMEEQRPYYTDTEGRHFLSVGGSFILEDVSSDTLSEAYLMENYALIKRGLKDDGFSLDFAYSTLPLAERSPEEEPYTFSWSEEQLDGSIVVLGWYREGYPVHAQLGVGKGSMPFLNYAFKGFRVGADEVNGFPFVLLLNPDTLEVLKAHQVVDPGNLRYINRLAAQGDLDGLKQIAKNKKHLKAMRGSSLDGKTPMHLAALYGHVDVIDQLLAWKVEKDAQDEIKMRPILMAIQAGRADAVKKLIDNRVDVDSRNIAGRSLLQLAIEFGHWDVFQTLIEEGASLKSGSQGITNMEFALDLGRERFFSYLEEHGGRYGKASSDTEKSSLVFLKVCKVGSLAMAKSLYDRGISLTDRQEIEAILNAVMSGSRELLEYLLGTGISPDVNIGDGSSPLHFAAEVGNIGAVEVFLDAGLDVNQLNAQGVSPLYLAVARNHLDVVEFLLRMGADPNAHPGANLEPVWVATVNQNRSAVMALIGAGAVCRVNPKYAMALLDYALANDISEVVGFVVEQCLGADVKMYDAFPALWVAERYDSVNCVNVLKKLGAEVGEVAMVEVFDESDLDQPIVGRVTFPRINYTKELADEYGNVRVWVDILVRKDGKVLFPKVEDGLPDDLTYQVRSELLKWRLESPVKNGQSVNAHLRFPVDLKMEDFGVSIYELSELDAPPRAIKQVPPFYPQSLKRNGVEGKVWMVFVVDESGIPQWVQAEKSTHPEFEASAIQAIRQWRFQPGISKGKPVKTQVRMPMSFKLNR